MKLGPGQKKVGDDAMSANCDVIVFFSIFGQFAAIQKPDSGHMVYKTYVFINSNLLSSTQLLHYRFE